MNQHKANTLKDKLMAIRHPIRGLKTTFLTETSLRLEIAVLLILIPLAFIIGSNIISRILLITSWFLVIIMELINTAIETIVDRIGFEHHKLSAKAKDIGSAAVLMAGINAITIWLLLIIKFFNHH
jgi:diacylglycerol kinase (ATP)